MRPLNQRAAHVRAVLAWAAALAFLVQAFSVGFATGAMAESAPGDLICVTKSVTTQKAPGAPELHDSCPICCILHSSSAIENELAELPAKAVVEDASPLLPVPVFHADILRVAPELRPLCSRAPPARFS
jgi:hypothetical protein